MLVVAFLFVVVAVAFLFGTAAIVIDVKEDFFVAPDWFWAAQVYERFYIPSEFDNFPSDDELEEFMVVVSEDGLVWHGKVDDLREWGNLQFELEMGWEPADITWVEETDADPSDDGVVLYTREKTYTIVVPMVTYEETDPSLLPVRMDEAALKTIQTGSWWPFWTKRQPKTEDTWPG